MLWIVPLTLDKSFFLPPFFLENKTNRIKVKISAYVLINTVLCRLRGVPLIDGGTIRLPRLIGLSRAMDLILTGRIVSSEESIQIGLATYHATSNQTALQKALEVATLLVSHPQTCMRLDRMSALNAWDAYDYQCGYGEKKALEREFGPGRDYLQGDEFMEGTKKFLQKSRL